MHEQVLVTGGAGFIGSHVVDALLAKGYAVSVVDALVPQVHGASVDQPAFLPAEARFVRADLCDAKGWGHLLADADAVIHLAAEVGVGQSMYEMVRYVRANALGTAVLLQSILERRRGLRKLVVASSMSIYGEGAYHCAACGVVYPRLRSAEQLQRHEWEMRCPGCGQVVTAIPTREDKPLYPTSIYAITKRDHEEMCLTFGRAYGIPTVALRFFNVYGSRQALSNPYTGMAAIFSSRLLNGAPPLVFEDGQQKRDLVHVSDIVQGVLLALEDERTVDEVYNVGTGQPVTVLEVAHALAERIGVEVEPEIVYQYRAGDIRHCYADIGKIRRALGYEPRVPFRDGIDELIAWVSGQRPADRVGTALRELAERGLVE